MEQESGDCATCSRREFPWLDGDKGSGPAVLCGRNAVQVAASGEGPADLVALAEKLSAVGAVTQNEHLVRVAVDGHQLTVFGDGRTIVSGTDYPAAARTLVARYVGT